MHFRQYLDSRFIILLLLASVLLYLYVLNPTPIAAEIVRSDSATHDEFISLLQRPDPVLADKTLQRLDENWSAGFTPMLLETVKYSSSTYVRNRLMQMLAQKTGEKDIGDMADWYQWLWHQPENMWPEYGEFKASLYALIDPKFEAYFRGRQASAQIRLDEIQWGGVVQDGIPPLRNPSMLKASEADYLGDDDIVFGVAINGDVRAYPKRILAWHEMFVDSFGEGADKQAIAGVYCTLCGTVIIYKTQHKEVSHQLGTSGFLYRSNKLMYDKATQSMWSTVRGEPVLGPLVGKGIVLEHLSVVTTTWKEWRRRHPETLVLSLDTGYRRNYDEGVAYKDYFSNDRLMFDTPFSDKRLQNKQEVLALRFFAAPNQQLAIDTDFLSKHPVYSNQIGPQKFVVLTDATGANRVYDPGQVVFVEYDGLDTVIDSTGKSWSISEQSLVSADGETLEHLPYHRAFWFGWHAAFPETKLIK
ncbi:MAG: DUF3179 domain-containing protein [Xanthomonadales bacterium]|nr:DUF3179 domain-containing protein [Xanthomonadales bacterium]